ncbi:MAG TPA: hypothetical protein VF913_12080 [Xanthobacteraceae bacterium]
MAERQLTDIVQVRIRMPEHLRRRIDVQATERGRTLNDECVRLLVKALDEDPQKVIQILRDEVRNTIKTELAEARFGGEGGMTTHMEVIKAKGKRK